MIKCLQIYWAKLKRLAQISILQKNSVISQNDKTLADLLGEIEKLTQILTLQKSSVISQNDKTLADLLGETEKAHADFDTAEKLGYQPK